MTVEFQLFLFILLVAISMYVLGFLHGRNK